MVSFFFIYSDIPSKAVEIGRASKTLLNISEKLSRRFSGAVFNLVVVRRSSGEKERERKGEGEGQKKGRKGEEEGKWRRYESGKWQKWRVR